VFLNKLNFSEDFKTAFFALKDAVSPWPRPVFWGFIIFLLKPLLTAAVPYLYGTITDLVIQNHNFKLIAALLLIWIILSQTETVLSHFGGGLSNFLTINSVNRFILTIFSHVLHLPLSFHKAKKLGSIHRRILNGGDRGIYVLIDQIMFNFLPDIVLFFTAVSILYFVNWRLSSILLAFSVIYVIISALDTKKIIKFQKILEKSWEKSYGFIYDASQNVHNVKLTGNEKFEQDRIGKLFLKTGVQEIKLMNFWRTLSTKQGFLMDFSFISVFTLGLFFLSRGELTPGQLIMFIGYTSLLTRPLAQITNRFQQTQRAISFVNRAVKLLDFKPEDINKGRPLELKGRIEFKNVSFSYKSNQNLRDENISKPKFDKSVLPKANVIITQHKGGS